MATSPAVTQWDAEGKPLSGDVREWDSSGKPIATVAAIPKWTEPGGIAYHLRSLRNKAVAMLPAAGGLIGGLIGAGAGVESGPGAVGTAAAGAAAGGGLGEDARQAIMESLYPNAPKMSAAQAATEIGKEAGVQGATELGGQVSGRLVGKLIRPVGNLVPEEAFTKYPFLKSVFAVGEGVSPKATQHLTAAASNKTGAGPALKAVTTALDDLEQEMSTMPANERTVGGFLKAVNSRKDAMNLESGTAMMPIRGQEISGTGIADNIRKLVRSYMPQTVEGARQRGYILKRASEFEKAGWTYGKLDELRTDLASQLAKHNAKGGVARYTAEKGDLDLAIDNAILDGLRDTVYPAMDRAAGKPAGYFENLKSRQSALITLEQMLDKRIQDLSGQQAISEVTPRLSTENISGSVHAGSAPRLGIYGIRQVIAPTRELKAASKHVAKAFPTVNTLPYQILFSAGARIPEAEHEAETAPQPQNAGDILRQAQ